MEKCPKCGNKLSSIDVLCPKCGALVEVVQVRKGTSAQIASSALGVPIKKLPQQNLILYNDDWPSDDMEGLLLPDETPPIDTQNIDAPAAPKEPVPPVKENATMQMLTKAAMYANETEVGSEEGYLKLLRNMHLPEIESINPYETATKPENTESAVTSVPDTKPSEVVQDSPRPLQRRWLEIEEVEPASRSDASVSNAAVSSVVDSGIDDTTDASDLNAAAPPPSPTPDAEIASADGPAPGEYRRRYHAEHVAAQESAPRHRKAGKAIMMVFVWLVIACVIFSGFYFMDQYVTDRFGGYSEMIFEMSNGNIDLNPSADAQPVLDQTPAS